MLFHLLFPLTSNRKRPRRSKHSRHDNEPSLCVLVRELQRPYNFESLCRVHWLALRRQERKAGRATRFSYLPALKGEKRVEEAGSWETSNGP